MLYECESCSDIFTEPHMESRKEVWTICEHTETQYFEIPVCPTCKCEDISEIEEG